MMIISQIKTTMRELVKKYEIAKEDAVRFMKSGQIGDYFKALLEMKKYKRLIKISISN